MDVATLTAAARETGYEPALLETPTELTERQPDRLLDLLAKHVDSEHKCIAVLGLVFKSQNDDSRNSRAIPVIESLQDDGADVVASDPS